ncbi:MAG: hypothetical protein R3Y21_02560 [Mycoplasmatota bacterium]
MKRIIIPFMTAVFIGIICGIVIINQYPDKEELYTVFNDDYNLYFMQIGTYSSEEEMKENLNGETYYIYSLVDNVYYVYFGITADINNIDKLKGYFNTLGYDVYVKEITLDNEAFKVILDQYDALLSGTEDENTISAICSQVLAKYEEWVLTE